MNTEYFLALFAPFNGEWKRDNARKRVNSPAACASSPRSESVFATRHIIVSSLETREIFVPATTFFVKFTKGEREKDKEDEQTALIPPVCNLAFLENFDLENLANNWLATNCCTYACMHEFCCVCVRVCLFKCTLSAKKLNKRWLRHVLLRLRWGQALLCWRPSYPMGWNCHLM